MYNRKALYFLFLADFMFMKKCEPEQIDSFSRFIEAIRSIGWDVV
jgi:hypothetical protein